MRSRRKGLSSVYGFIVIFTLLMAGIGAALGIMDAQASIWSAQDRARQIQASQEVEHLALSLNGTSLSIRNVGLIPSQLAYLYQKGAATSADNRIGSSLQQGSNLTLAVTAGMTSFAVITSLGNIFWADNSTQPATVPATVPVTFDASGLAPSFGSSPILTVDGAPYSYSSLPRTFEWNPGSSHAYSYVEGLSASSGSRVGWSSARGLSSAMSGTLTAKQSGSILSTYTQQYLLAVSGGNALQYVGSPSNDGWYDSGSTGQFESNYVWGSSGGSRQNLLSYSLDGSSATDVVRSGSGTYTSTAFTMSAPHTVTLNAITQYQIATAGGAGVTLGGSQTFDGWFDTGSTATVTTGYVWNLVAGNSRLDLTSWNLDGGMNQSVPRAGAGTYTTSPITMNSFHTVNLNSVTQYYVTERGNASSSGSVGPVTMTYSYKNPPTTLSSWLQNPSFESGSLSPWYLDINSNGAGAGITTTNPYSPTFAAYIYLSGSASDCNWSCWGQLDQSPLSLPSNAIVTSITSSVWYYVSNGNWEVGIISDNCGGAGAGGSATSWTQLSYTWSGTCATSSVRIYLVAGSNSQAASYYTYFDDTTASVTYTTPVSGSVSSAPNSFSVSGGSVTYTYGVGYAFPAGSTSTSWSASWPSTESFVSTNCLGSTVSGSTEYGTAGPCTLTTKSSGAFGLSIGQSPTGDGWYDAGSTISISAVPSGPFAFGSWVTSNAGLLVTAAISATSSVFVNSAGTITANFAVIQ